MILAHLPNANGHSQCCYFSPSSKRQWTLAMLLWSLSPSEKTGSFLLIPNMPGSCVNFVLSAPIQSIPNHAKTFFESSKVHQLFQMPSDITATCNVHSGIPSATSQTITINLMTQLQHAMCTLTLRPLPHRQSRCGRLSDVLTVPKCSTQPIIPTPRQN